MADSREDRWNWDETDLIMSICPFCIHKHPNSGKCDAYILGIPDDFLDGSKQHLENVKGDLGIKFEQDPAMPIPKGLQK